MREFCPDLVSPSSHSSQNRCRDSRTACWEERKKLKLVTRLNPFNFSPLPFRMEADYTFSTASSYCC